jgi:hypothetical protein
VEDLPGHLEGETITRVGGALQIHGMHAEKPTTHRTVTVYHTASSRCSTRSTERLAVNTVAAEGGQEAGEEVDRKEHGPLHVPRERPDGGACPGVQLEVQQAARAVLLGLAEEGLGLLAVPVGQVLLARRSVSQLPSSITNSLVTWKESITHSIHALNMWPMICMHMIAWLAAQTYGMRMENRACCRA